jgi:TAFII55 protein conserved region
VFSVGGEAFPAHVLNLPTIVESYKTYDDIHLVKSNDIGQVPALGMNLVAGYLPDCCVGTGTPEMLWRQPFRVSSIRFT